MRRLCSHDHPPGTLILVVVLLVAGGAEAKAVQTYAATAGSTVSGRVAGIPKTAQYLKSVLPPATAAALNTLEGVANKHQFHSARVAGSSFEYPEESLMLLNASRARPGEALNTICEIGFNAGLSAELLLAHNNASLHEFDILENPWSRAVMATFHALHPGRLTMHAGDTSCTVRRALRGGRGKPDILCDRFFVDGDHSEPQVTNDFYAAIRFTRPGGLVLIDDYTHRFPDVKPAWDRLVSEGFVQNSQCAIKRLQPPTGWRGFCVGQRTHKPLREHGLPKPVDCSIRRPLESQAVFEARRPSGDRDHETSE